MSLFNWFSGKSQTTNKSASAQRDADTAPQPRHAPAESSPADSAETRHQRHARREHLYLIIRESMTRIGVLSGSYKFKVLSVDPQGAEFMVMMDMMDMADKSDEALGTDGFGEKFNEMEALIIQSAWSRFEVTVLAVYWRCGVAASSAAVKSHTKPAPQAPVAPTPIRSGGIESLPTLGDMGDRGNTSSASPSVARKPLAAPAGRFDPIQADEFSAFKAAMKAASRSPSADESAAMPKPSAKTRDKAAPSPAVAVARQSRKALPSYTLLTGFEETQLPDPGAYPEMSRTQYGDLR